MDEHETLMQTVENMCEKTSTKADVLLELFSDNPRVIFLDYLLYAQRTVEAVLENLADGSRSDKEKVMSSFGILLPLQAMGVAFLENELLLEGYES